MYEIKLLSAYDIYAFNENKIDIFKNNSPIANFTDYAYFSINNMFMQKIGRWWLRTGDGEGNVDVVCEDGKCYSYEADSHCIGTRPVISYYSIKNEVKNIIKNENDVLEGEYGEYIQRLVSDKKQIELEFLYLNDKISCTGKFYDVIMPHRYVLNERLEFKKSSECIYNNQKFVRVEKEDKGIWFEVLPIKWLISINNDIMITKDIIMGRIPMQIKDEYYIQTLFEYTDMYKYLNNNFIEEIIPSKIKEKVLKK